METFINKKMKQKYFIFSIMMGLIILASPLIISLDRNLPLICGGDKELLIGCLGDEKLTFLSADYLPEPGGFSGGPEVSGPDYVTINITEKVIEEEAEKPNYLLWIFVIGISCFLIFVYGKKKKCYNCKNKFKKNQLKLYEGRYCCPSCFAEKIKGDTKNKDTPQIK